MSPTRRLKERLVDFMIRRKVTPRLRETPFDRFKVSVARTEADHREAFQLVHVAYAWLGIEAVGGQEQRMTQQHVLPESTIFIARDEAGRLVGTMTVTLDSDAGLPLDRDYDKPMAELRRRGHRLVEYGSLAVVQRCKHQGVTTLLSMAANYFSINVLAATDVVMGVHPKAAPFYRALFDFKPLGDPCSHVDLVAPVQGMSQDLSTIERFFHKYHRAPMASSSMPTYFHFFSELPDCIEMPPQTDLDSFARWKLPRAVFRRLFIENSDHLQNLDLRTRAQLQGWRSLRTTGDVPVQAWKEVLA